MKQFLVICLFLSLWACTRSTVEPPTGDCVENVTYSDNVKDILDNSCAYSGCHIDNAAPGDYSSYAGLQSSIDNGLLQKRMVELQDMPPIYAPDDKPKSLTEDEIEIISCWVQNEYAE